MQALKDKILSEGQVIGDDILKVDGFLNHQIDTKFLEEIGCEFKKRFEGCKVDKILTVEASGIAVACETAKQFGSVPVVFAKKAKPNTIVEGCYSAEARSFTKGTVANLRVVKRFVSEGEKLLILDDFLASGEAAVALIRIAEKAGAEVVGFGAVIDKTFQGGRQRIQDMGVRVEALASIERFENGKPIFTNDN
ncbi:MAG: xanthine phosphoribosyltransferase [Clostridiales bacterium]|nr:xanthine phosphoribosyltransferase [Clostridiales bacterium]